MRIYILNLVDVSDRDSYTVGVFRRHDLASMAGKERIARMGYPMTYEIEEWEIDGERIGSYCPSANDWNR